MDIVCVCERENALNIFHILVVKIYKVSYWKHSFMSFDACSWTQFFVVTFICSCLWMYCCVTLKKLHQFTVKPNKYFFFYVLTCAFFCASFVCLSDHHKLNNYCFGWITCKGDWNKYFWQQSIKVIWAIWFDI